MNKVSCNERNKFHIQAYDCLFVHWKFLKSTQIHINYGYIRLLLLQCTTPGDGYGYSVSRKCIRCYRITMEQTLGSTNCHLMAYLWRKPNIFPFNYLKNLTTFLGKDFCSSLWKNSSSSSSVPRGCSKISSSSSSAMKWWRSDFSNLLFSLTIPLTSSSSARSAVEVSPETRNGVSDRTGGGGGGGGGFVHLGVWKHTTVIVSVLR